VTESLAFDIRARFTARGAEPFDVSASLSAEAGETLVLLGPSGSGKTLLLECLGGFHDHDGTVTLDGSDVTDVQPEARGFGFVFQEYALFPHLTVRENVAFGSRYHEETRDPSELLSTLGVAELESRTPVTLSGGEKQRVALARALAIDPEVLLLDEPLAALDAPTRQRLRDDLADVLADRTAVYVTHDRTTARALGDRIAVMNDGKIHQIGSPEEVFGHPNSAFVARFVGANVVPAAVLPESVAVERGVGGDPVAGDGGGHELADGEADADGNERTVRSVREQGGEVAVRPEHVDLRSPADAELVGRVVRSLRTETAYRVVVDADGVEIAVFTDDPPAVGDDVGIAFPHGVTALET
jgi:thiamine transport system ATP-binding protein